MTGTSDANHAILALILVSAPLAGKGATERIIIKGGDLVEPIEIADSAIAGRFSVGTGPGTTPNYGGPGMIIDWDRGIVRPPRGLTVYDVLLVTTRRDPSTYVARYAIDPSTGEGYVYLPGKGEPEYRDNTWLIYRGVEGNWFHAWQEWEKVANPLIAKAVKTR